MLDAMQPDFLAPVYGVVFDLYGPETEEQDPGCAEIGTILARYSFRRVHGNLYVTEDENMANLFVAIQELKKLPWFRASVRDIHAFRIEQWSDFTPVVKTG
jgi:virulence-associated protein VapD